MGKIKESPRIMMRNTTLYRVRLGTQETTWNESEVDAAMEMLKKVIHELNQAEDQIANLQDKIDKLTAQAER